MSDMNGYDLGRKWFDFCFANPEKIKPNHTALYMFCIEHCNRLGWKKKFGLPTTMAKEAIGIRSYNTFINTLKDLIDWGFIDVIEKSKNQYSSNIIALSNYDKAPDRALDKALAKHAVKKDLQVEQSIDDVIKRLSGEKLTDKQIESLKMIIGDVTKKKKESEDISHLFTDENKQFIPLVSTWFEYKKSRRETYKSDTSKKAFITRIQKLSGNNVAVAKEIIQVSMGNNWQGVFALKKNHKVEGQRNTTDQQVVSF